MKKNVLIVFLVLLSLFAISGVISLIEGEGDADTIGSVQELEDVHTGDGFTFNREEGIVEIQTESDFYEYKDIHDEAIIVFYAEWCPYCRSLDEDLPEVKEQYQKRTGKDIFIMNVNLDKFDELPRKYRVLSTPTILIHKSGEELEGLRGAATPEFLVDLLIGEVD